MRSPSFSMASSSNTNPGTKLKYCSPIKPDVRICKLEFSGNWLNWLSIAKVTVGNRFFGFSAIDSTRPTTTPPTLTGERTFKLPILSNSAVRR
ncbi:Uncharacterised protein [Vibrio cholerae]|nr:Uncharacterised protein [Vibrio cholerae]